MRVVAIGLCVTVLVGCFATEAPGRGEGALSCGGQGLSLGDPGCRAHVVVDELGIDLADARGLEPQLEGFHYLAVRDDAADVRLLLPTITPGLTGKDECASLKLWDGALYSSNAAGGGLEVELEARDDGALGGTFRATVCTALEDGADVECVAREGRFAARVERDAGPAVAGGACVVAADCAEALADPRAGSCGLVPICDDGVCTTQ